MKNKLFIPLFLVFLMGFNLLSVCDNRLYASYKHKNRSAYSKITTGDVAELNYDIKRLNFKLNVTDTSSFIKGDVTTAAVVSASSLSSYVFELDSVIVIDSAKINGVVASVVRAGYICTINLSTALPHNTYFSVEVYYHGIPPASGGFFTGITYGVSTHGTKMIYSVTDPYAGKDWWPCKQDLDDKIDTVDMFVTVPDSVKVGSNGLLVAVDSATNPGFWTFHWQTHYAIDYYLISIAAAKYVEYRSYLHFTGSTDSMLIQNFFIDTATFNPEYLPEYDSIGQIIDYFSTLFGRYPFWKEKYGMCYTTLPGGMEHQTMTTIGNPYTTFTPYTYIIAHELCHQWFGDNVSYKTWGDTWLSEGFATFAEQLFYTHFWSPAAGKAHRQSLYNSAMGSNCGSVFVTDTTTATTIFYQPMVYYKGMAVINMLRYTAPVDSQFFTVLQTYQNHFGLSNANTNDLKTIADSIYGMNLDTFFNQWIYGQGYPKYKIWWNQIGSTVYVKLVQSASCPATTPLFKTYLELQLHSLTADTIVKVYNYADTQLFSFNWAPAMNTVYLNPDVWVLCKLIGTATHDTALPLLVKEPNSSNLAIYPNPTKTNWQIQQLPENTPLTLSDITGKILWTGISTKGTTTIPGKHLPTGNYFLKLDLLNDSQTVKIVHW